MAEENLTPVSGTQPPAAKPMAMRPSTLKLKPVIRKPTLGGTAAGARPGMKLPTRPGMKLPTQTALKKPETTAEAPAAPAPMEQLKSVTQKLKGITQQIPQQAILRKTGIIAEGAMSEAQKEAAKHKTARISLSDAMGVAPVKDEAAPMKTIRIKRPTDIPGAADAAPAAAPADEASDATNVTQRKTLKISRPGAAVRPSGKFTVKKQPADEQPADAVADIPDLPADSAFVPANGKLAAAAGVPQDGVEKDVSKGVSIMSIIIQSAACIAMGLLVYKFYIDIYETSPF